MSKRLYKLSFGNSGMRYAEVLEFSTNRIVKMWLGKDAEDLEPIYEATPEGARDLLLETYRGGLDLTDPP